jgi:hypothetical protein
MVVRTVTDTVLLAAGSEALFARKHLLRTAWLR